MTLAQLQATLYADFNLVSPASTVVTRILGYINEAHRKVLRTPGLTGIRDATLPLTSTANIPTYAFPRALSRIDRIVDPTTQRRLRYATQDFIRALDPGSRSFGLPTYYAPLGYTPTFAQPGSTGVWVASDNAGDTTQHLNFVGVRANGDVQAAVQATLNGTSRVAIGAITDYIQILRADLDATALGTVSLYDASSAGNTLGRIAIGATSAGFLGVRLWPTPSSSIAYLVDGQAAILDLAQPNDVPMFPDDFHDLILCYARWKQWKKDGDTTRADPELAEFDAQLGALNIYINFPNDYRPIAGSQRQNVGSRWNNLGGSFPADGYGE